MRTTLLPMFVLALHLIAASRSVQAHWGDRVYPIYELTESMLKDIDVTDGLIDQWPEIGPPSATGLDFSVFANLFKEPEYDPSTLDFRLWLGWSASPSRIYVALACVDNVGVNRTNYDPEEDHVPLDGFNFWVDADHSGGGFHPTADHGSEEYKLQDDAQVQDYRISPDVPPGEDNILGMSAWADWPEEPPFGQGFGITHGENPSIWVVEFYLTPFDLFVYSGAEESAVSALSAGKVIGFRCLVHDADGGALFTENFNRFLLPAMGLDAYLGNEGSADLFADGVLIGAEGTVVEDLTWGRIKASLIR